MTKAKPKPDRALDAVKAALERAEANRQAQLKPIEIVKVAISAYQAHANALDSSINAHASAGAMSAPDGFQGVRTGNLPVAESDDRAGLRRGTQSSVDRLLFNVNYWRAAYEDRIVAACSSPDDARACLKAICAWNSHTLKLNTLEADEVVATFERFCPPLVANNRRGSKNDGLGKGPIQAFRDKASEIALRETPERAEALRAIVADIEAETQAYAAYEQKSPLDALYELLPAWCLQEKIELVTGDWWNDADVMLLIAERMKDRFAQMKFGDTLCTYFMDSFRETLDEYLLTISTTESMFANQDTPSLIKQVKEARLSHPDCETQGYGDSLPPWLSAKEQLIWNTVVCAVYGPLHTRPLLADDVNMLSVEGKAANADVITDLAERAYANYMAVRRASGIAPEYGSYHLQPENLKNSGLERIESIPDKLKILGYRIVPAGSCYPEQRVLAFTPSEIECLAVLEHRRWLEERTAAGWTYSAEKDIAAKKSPYLLIWEELPDRAREWNRSSIRDIPTLLATVGLAIVK